MPTLAFGYERSLWKTDLEIGSSSLRGLLSNETQKPGTPNPLVFFDVAPSEAAYSF
jgi:hypothetical protein